MNLQNILLSAALLGFSASVLADTGGTLYHNGTPIPLTSGYAYLAPDHFDSSKQVLEITLSDIPIDAATIDAGKARREDLREYLRNHTAKSVSLTLNPDNKDQPLAMIGIAMDGYMSSGSMGSSFYALDIKRNDGKRIEGSFRSTHEKDKTSKNDDYYDLHFALDIASGPPFGPGMPADGGEPYKAFGKFGDALFRAQSEHYADIGDTVSKARYQELLAAQKKDKATLKKLVDKMWGEHINNNARFMQGRIKGDVATFDVGGAISSYSYDAAGNMVEKSVPTTVTVTMKKEDGAWVFDGQTLKKSAEVAGAK
jgi:YD repeat-containing protein